VGREKNNNLEEYRRRTPNRPTLVNRCSRRSWAQPPRQPVVRKFTVPIGTSSDLLQSAVPNGSELAVESGSGVRWKLQMATPFKVVLLGEGCVGKTSLVLRYCQNTFNDKHLTTLQVSALSGHVCVGKLAAFTSFKFSAGGESSPPALSGSKARCQL
jgi:hypothetical protein